MGAPAFIDAEDSAVHGAIASTLVVAFNAPLVREASAARHGDFGKPSAAFELGLKCKAVHTGGRKYPIVFATND